MVNEWPWRNIRSLGKVVTGKTPSTRDPQNFGGPYPFITIPDLERHVYIRDTARTISEQGATLLNSCLLPANAVMMSCIATVGKCGITVEPSFTNQQINSVICNKNVEPRYLYYCFRQLKFQLEATGGGGSVYTNVSKSRFSELEVPIPPLPEQHAIAAVLGALDDKIELNRQMNKPLEEMAQAIFKSWFVDFEPFRDQGMQDSPLGPIPRGWDVVELGTIAEVIDCLHSKKPSRQPNGKPLLQLWNIRDDGLIDMTDTFYIDEEDYNLWTSRIEGQEGDCVITNVGRVAATAQIPCGLRAALGRNMTAIRCRQSFTFPTFLIECLKSSSMKKEIMMKTDIGTILDAMNVKDIPRLRLVKPPTNLVERFEIKARPLRNVMEKKVTENYTLAAIRDTLLPKLLSGEIRVKNAEKFMENAV